MVDMAPTEKLEYTGDRRYQPEHPGRDDQGHKLYPYLPDPGLIKAVNLAIALERPLLIQGEPGCGKTLLARAIAYEFGQRYLEKDEWPYFRWNITSRSQAQDGRYIYDAIGKLRDAQMVGNEDIKKYMHIADIKKAIARLENRGGYITWGALGNAFREENHRPVLLIDEIDKADIDFPNDLLAELEDTRFTVTETQFEIAAKQPPIVIVTSNSEKELPEAFLRRCIFYYVDFPDKDRLQEILAAHFPEQGRKELFEVAITKFLDVRDKTAGRSSRKQSSTSELVDWMRILTAKDKDEAFTEIENLMSDSAQLGILLKSRIDVERVYIKPSDPLEEDKS